MDNETLIKQIRAGDKDLIYNLWSNNLPLIRQTVKRYECPAYPAERNESRNSDLMQESYLCLMECLPEYDESKGQFISFYLSRLNWHFIRVISTSRGVSVPVWFSALQNKYQRYRDDYYKNNGVYPDDNTLCNALNISNKALQAVKGINLSIRSLDVPVGGSDADLMLWEIIPDDAAALSDSITDGLYDEELKSIWGVCKDNTTQREYEALSLRYRENQTIQQTADSMGVSVQRVNSLNEVSLSKLRRCSKLRELAGVNDADLPEKVYFCGGYRNFKNNKDTSLVERLAIKNTDKRRRKRNPKQEDIKELERELIDFFGDVV